MPGCPTDPVEHALVGAVGSGELLDVTGRSDREIRAEVVQLATATGSGQALAAAGWVLTLLGWGSATLVVAGYTGLVRRS